MSTETSTPPNIPARRRALITLVITGCLGAAGWLWHDSETRVSTDNAFVECTVHTVAPRVGGTVIRVPVADNQFVRKGDLLMELDTADLAAHLDRTSAELALASNESAADQAAVERAKAAMDSAQVKLAQAELDLQRGRVLSSRDVIPKAHLERLTTAQAVARAEMTESTERLRQASALVGNNVTGSARTAIKQAQHHEAALALSYARILAPSNGYVTRKGVEPGNVVQAGQPVMALVDMSAPWIVANFKERQLAHIRVGQEVRIKVDAYPDRTLRGRVKSIMAGTGAAFSLLPPENASGNYVKVVQRVPVRIAIEEGSDPKQLLRPGMSVVPTVMTRRTLPHILAGTTPDP